MLSSTIPYPTSSKSKSRPSSLDVQFVDFDGVRFHLSTGDRKTLLTLSMNIRCWDELAQYGAWDVLGQQYGSYLKPPNAAEPGYHVSLEFDIDQVPKDPEAREALIKSAALLRRHALAAPFIRAFATHRQLESQPLPTDGSAPPLGELMAIHYRDQEAIYVQASHDRVTVVFSTVFQEETDRIFGKVFLQEFVDARRLPTIQTAPQVLYSNREPPLEIRDVPGLSRADDVGYVTFVLFPRHFSNPHVAEATISHIQLFRDNLHYHIKCSKVYMHTRMRARAAEFLKVLNRAKTEVAGEPIRKTVTSYGSQSSSTALATDLSKRHLAYFLPQEPSFDSPSSPSSSQSSAWDSASDSSDSSTSSSRASSAGPSTPTTPSPCQPENDTNSPDKYDAIHDILTHDDLYDVLATTRNADAQQLRRAYIMRSKRCHPDKYPEYPLATLAFQKVSFAYETLSHPSARRAYDKALRSQGKSPFTRTGDNPNQYHPAPDDTLNAVLYGIFCDYMDGDFEMIRTFIKAMGEMNARMQMSDDTMESLIGSLVRLREVLLVGRKYLRLIRFELIRLYEIQSNLRKLSYFDVRGRLRLTLQLARVTLSLPMVVDLAMREDSDDSDDDSDTSDHPASSTSRPRPHDKRKRERASRGSGVNGEDKSRVKLEKVNGRRKRGLIPPPVKVVIGLAIGALEFGERVL
ncbi:hypothetical protein FRB99_007291 [Tulasnella sp. 403]|nr:hypothetical protein FRB99_007291 [Tulasnella sp. 403]